MKKSKKLGAIIIICILLFLIVGIGLLKFIDYLEGPADDFSHALDIISLNFKNASNVFDNGLFNLFDDKAQINIDTKITVGNTSNTTYDQYKNLLETSTFITTVKYDKTNDYLSSNLKATKNGLTYELDYIEDSKKAYIKENSGLYEIMNIDPLNLKSLDIDIYPKIVELFKDKLKTYVLNREITVLNSIVTIDNNSYNATIHSISLLGSEVKELTNAFIESTVNDEKIYNYLIKIHDVSDNNSLQDKLLNTFEYNENKRYIVNIYKNTSNNNIIKLTFGEYSKTPFLSYEKVNNYHLLKLGKKSCTLIGTKDNFTLNILEDKSLTFTFKESGSSFSGTIKVDENESEVYHLEYSMDTQKSSENAISSSLLIKYYPTSIKKDMQF